MRGAAKTAGPAALLILLNAYVTQRLFTVDYIAQMGSIEGVYLGLARYVARHFDDLGWFPLWYGGIPYADSYPPLLHWICGLAMVLTGTSPGRAHHFVTALFYALGPAMLFWLAWRLTGNRACAFVTALGYSLLSPTCLLVPRIARDSGGMWGERRLQDLTGYGEGPHIASLCLLPLAIGLLHVALTGAGARARGWRWWAFAAVLAIAAVPLSNWLGAIAIAMAIAAYLLAGLPKGLPARARWGGAIAMCAAAYTIALPWLSPATIAVIRANAPRVGGSFVFNSRQHLYALGVAVGFTAAAWGLSRLDVARATRFAVLFAILTGAVNLGDAWFGISLVPQPHRYQLEMDMAFWTAAVFAVWPLVEGLRRREAIALGAILALPSIHLVNLQYADARNNDQPLDIRTTVEYKASTWLEAHLPGARVFAPGSFGYWLNAFGDIPQLTGGFDNGIANPALPHVIFSIQDGAFRDRALDMLRAYGVDAILIGTEDTPDFHQPVHHLDRFAAEKVLWREGGDAIYDTGRRSRSLAHVMRPADLAQYAPDYNYPQILTPYLAALHNPVYPPADFRWLAPSEASVAAGAMQPEQILSVQVSWDQGWAATANGRGVPVYGDKMGQIVVEPRCSGPCSVRLRWDGGVEGILTRWLSRVTLASGVVWVLMGAIWRRHSDSTTTN
jgi:hypothetical protein